MLGMWRDLQTTDGNRQASAPDQELNFSWHNTQWGGRQEKPQEKLWKPQGAKNVPLHTFYPPQQKIVINSPQRISEGRGYVKVRGIIFRNTFLK